MATEPRVAIVHDWLIGGGAERVIQELHALYPNAPIYTSYCTPEWRERLDNKVVTGWLQHLGAVRKFIPLLRARWFEHLDLSGFDFVISSSGNGEANHIMPPKNTLHVNYCHAPTHFYWRHYQQYLNQPGFGVFNPLARLGLRIFVKPLRKRDYAAAQRPDYIIVNSTHIQREIKEFYARDSVVIHPPVDTKRFDVTPPAKRSGFVTAGRQVPFKKMDLIVRACTELNLELTVIGRGPEHDYLADIAGASVTLLTDVSDQEMPAHFAGAKAFIFASYEDFGVTPVEAMAAGTPVIAYGKGGATDYVIPGVTGEIFTEQTVESLKAVLKKFDNKTYSAKSLKEKAQTFSSESFRSKLQRFIASKSK